MKITRGEFCQFSLTGRLQLLQEFGVFLGAKIIERKSVQLYHIYDFYVEVIYNNISHKVEHAEIVKNAKLVSFFEH